MTRLAWLTDPHLVFLRDPQSGAFDEAFFDFVRSLAESDVDGLLISGDISEGPELVRHLELLDDRFGRPIYFILGNHDFYKSSVARVRSDVRELCQRRQRLIYLSERDPVEMAPGVALVGHDAFADGRYGLFHWSDLKISDEQWIEDLVGLDDDQRLAHRQELGDEAARHLARVLPLALATHRQAIVLTHYPPFEQSARHRGKVCDYHTLPYYACKAVGDVLLEVAAKFTHRELLVLCGHTHERCEFSPVPNLRVLTGAAEYGALAIEQTFEV